MGIGNISYLRGAASSMNGVTCWYWYVMGALLMAVKVWVVPLHAVAVTAHHGAPLTSSDAAGADHKARTPTPATLSP